MTYERLTELMAKIGMKPPEHPNCRSYIMGKRRKKIGFAGGIGGASFPYLGMLGDLLYVLGPDGRTPVVTSDTKEWGLQLENVMKRRVATDKFILVNKKSGDSTEFQISTVFTGIAYNTSADGNLKPDTFETLVIRIDRDQKGKLKEESTDVQCRWASWDQAAEGHELITTAIISHTVNAGFTIEVISCYRPEGKEAVAIRERAAVVIPLPLDSLRKLLRSRNSRS